MWHRGLPSQPLVPSIKALNSNLGRRSQPDPLPLTLEPRCHIFVPLYTAAAVPAAAMGVSSIGTGDVTLTPAHPEDADEG